jgi:methyl-accepting chemotaxis protein
MAKENNKAVEQTAAAAKKLEHLASDLQDIVGRFRT